jgi:hypothetical protein
VATAVFVFVAGIATLNAVRQQKVAESRQLAANAATWQSDDPARALYFGLQTAKLGRLPQGLESVMATALSNVPSYALLQGHTDSVSSVAWSPGWEDPGLGEC